MMTRAEHLQWAKDRALDYADQGDLNNAMASMGSDLNKHPETAGHQGMTVWMMLTLAGKMQTSREVRDFINGFN